MRKIKKRTKSELPALLMALVMLGGCTKKEPAMEAEAETYTGITAIPKSGETEASYSMEWLIIPHRTDTIGTMTEERRIDAGMREYVMEYETRGAAGELRIEIRGREKIYEYELMDTELTFREGGYFSRPDYDGGGYYFYVMADGIYLHDGELLQKLEDFRMRSWHVTDKEYKGSEETTERLRGRTENAESMETTISCGDREYKLIRKSETEIAIRETKPREIDLGILEKE